MCCNAYYVSFAFNALISSVFFLIAGVVFSESLINAEVLNLDANLESSSASRQHVQKRYNPSATNTAWFGPRLGRKKRSLPELSYEPYINHPNALTYYLSHENDERSSSNLGRQKRSIILDDNPSDSSIEHSFEYYLVSLLKNYPGALKLFLKQNPKDDQFVNMRESRRDELPDEDERVVIRAVLPPEDPASPFVPRLGRRSEGPMAPRLGRSGSNAGPAIPRLRRFENSAGPIIPRLGRSGSNAGPASPRLGRSESRAESAVYKPRLGRSESRAESAIYKPRLGRDPRMNELSEFEDMQIRSIDDKEH